MARTIEYGISFNPKQAEGEQILSDPEKKYIKFYGGSRSGKTVQLCDFVIKRALKYNGSKHLIARYSRANARKTIWLQTILPLVRPLEKAGVCKINNTETIIEFKNGSIIIMDGLEPSRIDSVLAAEYGTIFITEANENKYETVENLFTRLNDTSKDNAGNSIVPKLVCDLNPTVERSWTNVLFNRKVDPATGEPKKDASSYASLWFHPTDNKKNLSDGYLETLQNLSPAKRRRFWEGKYGSFEGLVFPLDEDKHLVDPFELPKAWPRGRAIDFGYTHPFVCLWSAYDRVNDTVYIYDEWVQTRWTVRQHAMKIKDKSEGMQFEFTVSDHDAEDRATLEENGIGTIQANKNVLEGIDNVLDIMHNGRVKIFRTCTSLINGLYSYRYIDSDMTSRLVKDREVLKQDDDECDAFRYLLMEWFPVNGSEAEFKPIGKSLMSDYPE